MLSAMVKRGKTVRERETERERPTGAGCEEGSLFFVLFYVILNISLLFFLALLLNY